MDWTRVSADNPYPVLAVNNTGEVANDNIAASIKALWNWQFLQTLKHPNQEINLVFDLVERPIIINVNIWR